MLLASVCRTSVFCTATLNQLWVQVVKSLSRKATQCPLTFSQSSVAIVANGDQARCHSSRPLLNSWFSVRLATGQLLFMEVSMTEPTSFRNPPSDIFDTSCEFLTGMTRLSLNQPQEYNGRVTRIQCSKEWQIRPTSIRCPWKAYWIPGKESTSSCRSQHKPSWCSLGNWV